MSSIHQRYLASLAKSPNIDSAISKNNLLVKASLVLAVGAVSLTVTGCQSNNTLAKPTNSSASLIDFSIADSKAMQAQGQAFNKSLQADNERYQQLFDQSSFPNSDSQAKSHLMTAIRQHLATEHVAVARANYNAVPFISADSIDAGSTWLLRTILEVYAYREESKDSESAGYEDNDYNDNDYADYNDRQQAADTVWIEDADNPDRQYAEYAESTQFNEDSTEDVVIIEEDNEVALAVAIAKAELAEFELAYSKDGYDYDLEGYDREGYDENGYDRSGYDYDGFDESGYNYYEIDRDGYDRYGEFVEDYEADSTSDSTDYSLRERLANNNPKELLASYEAMQTAKQNKNSVSSQPSNLPSTNPFSKASPGVISLILNMLHKTPEQVAAANLYQYKHLTFNSVSQYLPKQRQFNSVYSYDYAAPTISASIQLPIALDFNTNKVTLDPAAIMPLVALANPENTPLQMTAHTVDFGLPETITSQLPPAVIYDAAINAMQASMAELAPEHFSAVDIREDSFAKQVAASRAVKVYFGSKQTGEIVGKMLKYMSQTLQQYVDANPSQYPDGALLKTAIEKIQLYNKGYQSADIGALLQLVEAVVPISFNQVNYYYLDSADKLLAKQQRINIGGDLMGSNTKIVNEIRYDRNSFAKNALTPLLAQSFGADAKPAMDGNAWLAAQRQQKQRLDAARSARYSYDGSDYDDSNYDDSTMEVDSAQGFEFENDNSGEATDYAGD